MKIRSVTSYAVAGPLSDLCFVRVETDEPGLVGWGESSLPMKCRAVASAIEELAPFIIGMDALAIERCWQRMYRHSYWRGGPILTSSISGIDMALWDIRGKYFNVPVYQLLGGAVRDTISLYANIGLSEDPDVLRERAAAAKAAGYSRVKFYPLPPVAGIESTSIIDRVTECCEAVSEVMGRSGGFALDFHGRCSANLAVQIEAQVRHTHPLWIEEPTPPENHPALQRCAEKFEVPIAGGERLFTRWGFRELLEAKWLDVLQPDVANAGGISEMMRIASLAELYGVALAPHNPNGPVQCLASLHIAAAAPAFSMLEHRYDMVKAMSVLGTVSPASNGEGSSLLPVGVGLGINLDEDYLRSHPAVPVIYESFRADGSIADW